MNLVSIIMPTFLRQHTIQRAVKSVLNQTHRDWQLVIVDNEPDHQYDFVDPRVECHPYTQKQSAAEARNYGIKFINKEAEFVCFFDDDDIMDPFYLEKMLEPFHEDSSIIMSHCKVAFEDGRMEMLWSTPSCLIRREFATPNWKMCDGHDGLYFADIYRGKRKLIWHLPDILVTCSKSRQGGLREGAL
jgi:glycosyltransferase involved in cell wall biosynthesis